MEFGTWFGVKVRGTFAPGARVRGQITHKGLKHAGKHLRPIDRPPRHGTRLRTDELIAEIRCPLPELPVEPPTRFDPVIIR
jgi:hypothetical protein